jgi:P22 coat protein - gene protein 5
MANALITPSVIAKEALAQLENNLVMGNSVHREYKKDFVKVGASVSIRKPVKFYTADGAARVNQDVEEANTSLVVDQRKHVSWKFSSEDLTLTIEDYSERYIKPAAITLAQTIDARGYDLYRDVWNLVGTPGTTPGSYGEVSPVAQRLDEMAVPADRRYLALNPAAHYRIAGDQVGLQNPSMVKTAYQQAQIGRIAALDAFSAQNVKSHMVGTHGGAPLVDGANQDVTYAAAKTTNAQTLATDGWPATTAVLKAGDVFTIAGVYAVNPVPGEGASGKTVLPFLQQFVVRDDVSSDGSGSATLTISPAIIVSGPYQSVDAAPADNAAITVVGTAATAYPQNLGFHRNAFALVTCPLEMPDGATWKARESHNGLSIRVVKDYDIATDDDIIRLDVLYGWKAIYPELACRLTG